MDTDILPELKSLEWNILNPDRLINLEIKKRRQERERETL